MVVPHLIEVSADYQIDGLFKSIFLNKKLSNFAKCPANPGIKKLISRLRHAGNEAVSVLLAWQLFGSSVFFHKGTMHSTVMAFCL
jgi:hypothetical protein